MPSLIRRHQRNHHQLQRPRSKPHQNRMHHSLRIQRDPIIGHDHNSHPFALTLASLAMTPRVTWRRMRNVKRMLGCPVVTVDRVSITTTISDLRKKFISILCILQVLLVANIASHAEKSFRFWCRCASTNSTNDASFGTRHWPIQIAKHSVISAMKRFER